MVQTEGNMRELVLQRETRNRRKKELAPDVAKTLKSRKNSQIAEEAKHEEGRPLDTKARYDALERKLLEATPEAPEDASEFENAKAAVLEVVHKDSDIDVETAIQSILAHVDQEKREQLQGALYGDPEIYKLIIEQSSAMMKRDEERLSEITAAVMELGEVDIDHLEQRIVALAKKEGISGLRAREFLRDLRQSPEYLRQPCKLAAENIHNKQLREWYLQAIKPDAVNEIVANLAAHKEIVADELPKDVRQATVRMITELLWPQVRFIQTEKKNQDEALNTELHKKMLDELVELDFGDVSIQFLAELHNYLDALAGFGHDQDQQFPREISQYAERLFAPIDTRLFDLESLELQKTFSEQEKNALEYLVTGQRSFADNVKALRRYLPRVLGGGQEKMRDTERLKAMEYLAIKQLAAAKDPDVWEGFQTRLDEIRGWRTNPQEHDERVQELREHGVGRRRFVDITNVSEGLH